MLNRTISKTLALGLLSLSIGMGGGAFQAAFAGEEARAIPEIEWDTELGKFQFDQKKFIGKRFTAKCPPTHMKDEPKDVEKEAIFPSTYSICMAGLQSGHIDKKGGIVTVQLNPGGEVHAGSAGKGAAAARTLVVISDSASEANDQIYREHIARIKWDTNFTKTGVAYKQLIGQRFTFTCPAAPGNLRKSHVMGTDLYAFKSKICIAAVHAGAITTDGGLVTIQMNPGKQKLTGSVRNGIETKDGTSGLSALSFVNNPITP